MFVAFLKHIMNVRKTRCNVMVYGELGKYSVSIHIKNKMLNYLSRLLNGKQDKMSYMMYKCLLRLNNEHTSKSPWLDYVRQFLNLTGMSGIWLY